MKYSKNIFLTISFLIFYVCTYSQMNVGIGKWRVNLAYNSTNGIAVARDKVFAISGGALYSLGKEDNFIETYSKIDGLSDNNAFIISYIDKEHVLFIGYENGNIDFFADNNTITNLPDIYNKNISADKKINEVFYYEGYLYLAMPFGIVKIDVSRNEVADTYYFRDSNGMYMNALSVFVMDNNLFVTTAEKIFKAPVKGVNLANFANWQELKDIPAGGNIKSVTHESKIYLLQTSGKVSVWSDNTWITEAYSDVMNINVSNGVLFFIRDKSIEFSQTLTFDFQPQMVVYDNNSSKIWIASPNDGIGKISYNNVNERDYYKPKGGPAVNDIWRMRFVGNKLFVVSGGRWDVPYGTPANVMIFENNQWTNVLQSDIQQLGVTAHDFVDIAVDVADNKHFFVSSWGNGLFEFKDDKPYRWYHSGNSNIENNLVGNIAFDNKRKLWLSNPMTPSFIKYAEELPAGDYAIKPVTAASSQSVWTTSDILIDNIDQNYKYLVVTRGHFKFVAINDKGTDDTGDDEIFMTSQFINQDDRVFRAEHYMCGIQDKITGSLWIGTTSGPIVLPNPRNVFRSDYRCQSIKIPNNNGEDGADYMLQNEVISTIVIDGNNRKWIGTEGSGAYLLSEDGTETIFHFTADNSPLLSNWIRTISINPDNGEVFFGTTKGLISYQGDAVEAKESFGSLHAFPNPVRPDYHGDIAIKGLAENSVVKITDVHGRLVFETFVKGGMAVWHGKGIDGKRVASGVYLAICNTMDGSQHGIVKILVIN